MTERWRDALANSAAEFGERLEALRFAKVGDSEWRGDIVAVDDHGTTGPMPHSITLPDDYPFEPPKVRPDPVFAAPRWHAEHPECGGCLCLYRTADDVGRPWEEPERLIEKVEEWYRQGQAGWPDDPGDLDLERYFEVTLPDVLVAFDGLDSLVGRNLEVEEARPDVVVVTRSRLLDPSRRKKKSERSAERRDRVWGAGVDLGHLDHPVADLGGVLARLDAAERSAVQHLVGTRTQGFVVARYSRTAGGQTHTGALALRVTRSTDGTDPKVEAVQVEDRQQARAHRRGPEAPLLADKSVAVVGVGAVGSFLAERLARAGIGQLTLVDQDRLRYGNSARHLVDERLVGERKTDAVKAALVSRRLISEDDVTTIDRYITAADAVDLIDRHDLVVDATGSSRAAGKLEHVARQVGEEWIKVALYRGGAVIRLDRFGPGTSRRSRRLPPVAALDGPHGAPEAGCGDPVSPTPPVAVELAASLTCEYAIDTLLRDRRSRHYPDSLVEVRAPTGPVGDDDPYAQVGRVKEPTR